MDAGKKSFLWLVAVFVAPILLGTLLFFNLENLGLEKGSVNYGTLIQPAFLTKTAELKQGSEPAVFEDTLAKKWTLLYIETKECTQSCLNRLLLMKRIRLLTNENMRRVRTLFVSSQHNLDQIAKDQNRDLVMANIDSTSSEFLKQFPDLEKFPVYLIDPFGNLMMYYPQVDPDAKKMLKDLHRLLKYSHLG
jgi:cytochrome oxidase Cu insertion factor (SCO1/SenC/PrrC family)